MHQPHCCTDSPLAPQRVHFQKAGWRENLRAQGQSPAVSDLGFQRGAGHGEEEEGAGALSMWPRCSAGASLGVFDKLTLCTLSVELSLSNTRSAALQLSLASRGPLLGASLCKGRGKRGTEVSGLFQLAKAIVTPPVFSLQCSSVREREPCKQLPSSAEEKVHHIKG